MRSLLAVAERAATDKDWAAVEVEPHFADLHANRDRALDVALALAVP